MKLKFCGMKSIGDIGLSNEIGPEYAGFVFAEGSRRKVSLELAAEMKKRLSVSTKAVGVFVNQPAETVLEAFRAGIIDVIQLHGDEDRNYISAIKKAAPEAPVIKAFRVKNAAEREKIENSGEYGEADFFLFDAYDENAYGGTGRQINVELIPETEKPYFLAGGLNAKNLSEIIDSINRAGKKTPYALDVSSGIEKDGKKDKVLMESFYSAFNTFREG